MLAGSTVRAFGLDTTDTQRVVDVLALSTASSALNFEGLTESLKLVAPTSRATGVSIEKTTALLGVLADSGLKGSIAGTGLSKTFIMLNKKGLTLEQGFEKINSSSNKMNTAIELVGIVGAKSLLNLASSGEKIEGLTKSFENAEGAARRMAELRLDNLAGDITKLGSAWDGFLLEVEDGGGIINKVQRFLTQLLTKGVEKLGVALDFYAFFVRDYFNFWAKGLSVTKEIAEGSFGYLTGIIKKFSNQAILLISEIPIIGKAIDADKAKANLLIAEAELDASQKRIQNGIDVSGEIIAQTNSFWARYSASEVAKEKRMAEQKAAKALEESSLEDVEAKKEEEARLKKEREKARLTREKLLAKYLKKEQDLLANDATKKLELERERAYKEIELISETKEQENALKLAYDAGYLIKKAEILFKLRGEAGDAEEKYNAEQVKLNLEKNKKIKDDNQALADAEEELRDMKIRATRDSLVALSQLFKQGTAASKAAALADLAIGTGVGFIQALDIAQKGAKGMGTLAPFAFPVFYATQVAAVLGAAAKAKGILSAVKGGGNVPTPTPPPVDNPRSFSVEPQAPQFNVVGTSGTSQIADLIGSQPPIKAYVVSSDVTTSQSLDRNIIESATI